MLRDEGILSDGRSAEMSTCAREAMSPDAAYAKIYGRNVWKQRLMRRQSLSLLGANAQ